MKKKKRNKKKNIKRLKTIIVFIVLILFVELLYVLYTFLVSGEKNLYFDGINSFKYSNNNYIVVGSNNDNDNHYEKAKLSILDSKQEKIKEKLYNKGFNSTFFDVITDGDSYVAVGSYESNRREHRNGNRRGLIVKYDSNGEVLFEDNLFDLANSSLNGIVKYGDYYYVCGNSNYSSNDINDSGVGGAYIIKYDKTGKVVWKRNFGDKSNAKLNSIMIIDDYLFAVGMNNINVGLVVKYDLNGNFITSYDYRSVDNLGFSNIAFNDGYFYVCGSKENNDYNTALIVKFDTDLNYIDEVTFWELGNCRFNDVMFDEDHLIVIGTIKDDDYDGMIAKYDSKLNYIDSYRYGDDEDDYFTELELVDNKYIVSGYSSYEDSLLAKFISFSDALKVLEVK